MFRTITQTADLVLIDAPPLLQGPDTMALANAADAVLLVINAKRTTKRSFERAMHQLALVNANILGEVLNDLGPTHFPYYGTRQPHV